MSKEKVLIGITRETDAIWERRVALCPDAIQKLLTKYENLEFIIQPSKTRIFNDLEFSNIGCKISEDIS